jgi:hypothetical protein
MLFQFVGPARPMSQAGADAITTRFKKPLVKRMLKDELTHPLGEPHGGQSRRRRLDYLRNPPSGKT